MKDNTFVINIGRQLGSGGRIIGKRIAEDLGIRFYDKELIYLAAKESGFSEELFEQNDEQKSMLRSFFSNLIPFVGSGDIYDNQVSEESLFRILSDTIKTAAEQDNCVFIGRCSEYILREKKDCISLFISANDEDRIKRICEYNDVTREMAIKLIHASDKRRAAFHDFYSSGAWGAATTYDCCINSSMLGLDDTTELVKDVIKKRFHL
ncbi:MAG: cytidylate kinase-like family protein [Bacteroidaceae bacterium]